MRHYSIKNNSKSFSQKNGELLSFLKVRRSVFCIINCFSYFISEESNYIVATVFQSLSNMFLRLRFCGVHWIKGNISKFSMMLLYTWSYHTFLSLSSSICNVIVSHEIIMRKYFQSKLGTSLFSIEKILRIWLGIDKTSYANF
jgi:hypothetical protein